MSSRIRRVGRALTAVAVLLTLHGIASATEVRCSSRDGKRRQCHADTSAGVILVQRLSKSPCEEGETWGYDDGAIWVDRGCRGVFETGGGTSSGHQSATDTIFGKIGGGNPGASNPDAYNIPDWAIGTFTGKSREFGYIELQVTADGNVYARSQKRQLEGDYYNGSIVIENTAFRITEAQGGMRLEPLDGGDSTFYRRVR
jgi:DUF3011 family protein